MNFLFPLLAFPCDFIFAILVICLRCTIFLGEFTSMFRPARGDREASLMTLRGDLGGVILLFPLHDEISAVMFVCEYKTFLGFGFTDSLNDLLITATNN